MAQERFGRGIVVVGGQWGDEGKGRIVDALAQDCDVVVRFQGGNNAGHSLHIGGTALVLHLIPCGIMRAGKVSMIGNGAVIDPEVLFQEMEVLLKHGVKCTSDNLKIARNAHVIFPFHKLIDTARENKPGSHIGTTKRGIGPCYEDKVARFGIVTADLLSRPILKKKLENVFNNRRLRDVSSTITVESLIDWARMMGERLAPFLCDVGDLLHQYLMAGQNVLFEGAQGALLDVDHGTYPYVTSSNCIAAQAAIGSGIGAHWLKEVLLVSKAYCTRVGEGPFFSEAEPIMQERLRNLGNEFGATTGRPRRCGWLDLPALKYAARINGATGLVITKVDILTGLGTVKIGVGYSCQGKKGLSFMEAMQASHEGLSIAMEYQELKSPHAMPSRAEEMSDFPETIRRICAMVEDFVGLPIRIISYGRERGQEFFVSC